MPQSKTHSNLKSLFLNAGLSIRQSQLDMILHVKDAILNQQKIVIEAPTATGKSFAYLIGALLANDELEKKLNIVISTATIALQEQLFFKDLNYVEQLLNRNIDYKIAKGRARYLCQRKFASIDIHKDDVFKMLSDHLDSGWSGDIDELSIEPDKALWSDVSTTSASCSKNRCEFYKSCSFYQARRNLKKCDVIIVNHNLLLAHLALGNGAILPEFDEIMIVVDECHHLPKKALAAFSAQATLVSSQSWINDLDKLLKLIPSKVLKQVNQPSLKYAKEALINDLNEVQIYFHQLYTKMNISNSTSHYQDNTLRITQRSEQIDSVAINIKSNAENLYRNLTEIKEKLDDFAEKSTLHNHQSLEKTFSQLGFMIDRFSNLLNLWNLMINYEQPPIAKWYQPYKKEAEIIVEEHSLFSRLQDYMISASPIEAGHLLEKLFWSQATNSVIMTSATIRSVGKFDRFLAASGLVEDTKTIALTSPLNYKDSQLIIPKMKVTPQNFETHNIESSEIIYNYLDQLKTGALVLFTSFRAMIKTYELLPSAIQSIVLKQGDYAKAVMINKHKKTIDNDQPSILFGLDSFAEGLDLPGNYLDLLILHKLPFSVPTDPIEKTKSEWVTALGKNAFIELALPDASLKLTQMCGRLVRREGDRGKIVILDNRIINKYYGKQMIENLPDFSINTTMDN
ncbi:MAG: ATP-dependent DNA helicase DinG [Gammaproteobacteria bacterium]|nr:MAG: ATP-dependent DNA helicase DinG [Gammaproteobacteria bacterium]UTW41830.1 ATP-dependent DNA helicase DinG [bacterium SCSIO 12844]